MITDPVFYFAAVPAVIFFGIAKGGFGSGLGILAVPLMAMVISPIQAAAILLCSDEAAYITGQVISISGGLTMAG